MLELVTCHFISIVSFNFCKQNPRNNFYSSYLIATQLSLIVYALIRLTMRDFIHF